MIVMDLHGGWLSDGGGGPSLPPSSMLRLKYVTEIILSQFYTWTRVGVSGRRAAPHRQRVCGFAADETAIDS